MLGRCSGPDGRRRGLCRRPGNDDRVLYRLLRDPRLFYTGVEYSVECFCGNTLAPAATQVAATQCNMPCAGDATQPCGGPSRLNLFHTTAVAGPQAYPGVNGFVHLGCYAEGTTGRALTYGVSGATVPGAEMTVDRCTAACLAANYLLAGVEYGGECYCGNH
jgi:hypothetical protein